MGRSRVGAHKVVGQKGDEFQQPGDGLAADLHGPVLMAEDDAVLVVVDIGGVLQEPGLAVQRPGG